MTKPTDRAIAQAFWEWHTGEYSGSVVTRAREIDAAAPEGEPGPESMRVIHPAEWEPCSPEYLLNGGSCDAPRVWHAETQNHWHPKRKPEGAQVVASLWVQYSDDGKHIRFWTRDQNRALEESFCHARPLTAYYTTPPQSTESSFVCTGDQIRCFDGNGCECELAGRKPVTDSARDREDAALVPIAWRHETPLGTGYKFSDEFLAKWPEFPGAVEDAERYRWLRDEANEAKRSEPMVMVDPLDRAAQRLIHGEELDAAIDAARAAGGGGSHA